MLYLYRLLPLGYYNMHELAVSQNILDTSIKYAKAADAKKILSINIVIGQFASIIDDSLTFYWDLITKETIAQQSNLEFTRLPAKFCCRECGFLFNWDQDIYSCPACSSEKIIIQSGTEFYIESIEVE